MLVSRMVVLTFLLVFALLKNAAGVNPYCKEYISRPINDCSMNSLLVGVPLDKSDPAVSNCNKMHSLSSPGAVSEAMSRMNVSVVHPQKPFSTSSYLLVSLAAAAEVFGFAVKVSNSYLSAFYLEYNVLSTKVIGETNLTETWKLYKESGTKAVFNMTKSYEKFLFNKPFVAKELKVHPIPWSGNVSSFQLELFGCFLGGAYPPEKVLKGQPQVFNFSQSQHSPKTESPLYGNRYTVTFKYQNSSTILAEVSMKETRRQITKTLDQGGITYVILWGNYKEEFIRISAFEVFVLARITGAWINSPSRFSAGYVFKAIANCADEMQVLSVRWDVGDGRQWTSYGTLLAKKSYARHGYYTLTAQLQNDLSSATASKPILICNANTYGSGGSIFNTTTETTNKARFYFWANVVLNPFGQQSTFINVSLNGTLLKSYRVTQKTPEGITFDTTINLPVMRRLEKNLFAVEFQDLCQNFKLETNMQVLAEVENPKLSVFQRFKNETRTLISSRFLYGVKMNLSATVSRGDEVSCMVYIHSFTGLTTHFKLYARTTAEHYYTSEIDPPYHGSVFIHMECANAVSKLSTTRLEKFIEYLPDPLEEMTTFCEPSLVRLSQSTYVKLKIKAGTKFDCEIQFESIGLQLTVPQSEMIKTESGEHSIFSLTEISIPTRGLHAFAVTCTNKQGSMRASGKLLVEAKVSGLEVSSNHSLCIGENALVNWSVNYGYPLHVVIKVADVVVYSRLDFNMTHDTITIDWTHFTSFATNMINVTAYNNVSSETVLKSVLSVLPFWKSLDLSFAADILFTPKDTQPVQANVTFSISPPQNQSFDHVVWTINNTTVLTNEAQRLAYSISSIGLYEISATVIGCWNVTVSRYLNIGTLFDRIHSPKNVPDCRVCAGATTDDSDSFVTYGQKNCPDSSPETELNSACPLYKLSSDVLGLNISERANYSLIRVDSKSGIAKIGSSRIKTNIKDCFSPVIEGRGLLLSASEAPMNVTNSQENVLEIFLQRNCPVLDYAVSWQMFFLGSRLELKPTQNVPIDSFIRTTESVAIPPHTLASGLYMVQVNASLKRGYSMDKNEASKDFFLNVTSSNPVAVIANGTSVTAPFPENYVLDGSKSRDPDQPINSKVSLMFTWICRDLSSQVIDPTDMSAINKLPVIEYSNAPLNSSGCFGKPQGILSRAKKLTLETVRMRENITYEIILIVSKSDVYGTKYDHSTQLLYVDFAERPQIDITCNENCLVKMIPNRRLSLSGTCEGLGCLLPIFYQWTLFRISNNIETRVNLQRNQTTCGFNKMIFVLRDSVLEPGQNYSLYFQASKMNGISSKKKYFLQLNEITVQGNCSISPNHGEGLSTKFNMTCTGWSDVDGPLEYSFFSVSDYLATLLCHGKNTTCLTSLQIVPTNGFYTNIQIMVTDTLGATAKLERVVKVVAPLSSINLMHAALEELSETVSSSLTTVSDVPVAIQKLSAITSMLNYLSENTGNKNISNDVTVLDRIRFRDKAVDNMLKLKFSNESRLNVIAPIAASLCSVPREVTSLSADKITAALIDMEKVIMEQYKSMSFDEVVRGANNFLIATASVIKASSINGAESKATNATTVQKITNWNVDKPKAITMALSTSTNNFNQILVFKLVPGEDPLIINSDSLKTLFVRKAIEDKDEIVSTNIANAEVALPKLESLGPGINNKSLDLVMKVYDVNPFFWSNSSTDVKSNVLDFKIIGSKVSNASDYIDLTITRPSNEGPSWTRNEFKEGIIFNDHKLTLPKGHSLHMEILPLNACIPMTVYMKYKTRPSKTDYDRRWTIPDFSNCSSGLFNASLEEICLLYKNITQSITNSTSNNVSKCFSEEHVIRERLRNSSNCTIGRNPFKIFVSNSDLKKGIYYIGVTPEDAKEGLKTTFNEKASSNCSITKPTLGYHMLVYTANCIYWNETKGWIGDGCKVGPRTTWNYTHCRCNHLTSFASDFLVAPNPIDMRKVLEGFKNLKDNLSVFIFICVLIAAYILFLVLLRKKDRADSKKLGVSVISPVFPSHRYLVVFVTGARRGAGTTANVYVVLNGDQRKSDVRVMRDSSRPIFNRDQINAFEVSFPEPLGELQSLEIWHDNTGASPSWYISHVYVEDLEQNKRYQFLSMRWLAVDEGDGQIEADLSISDDTDMKNFSHLFTSKVARKCSDEHLWLSVVLNRPHSTFTRAQRMTCCLCLLVTTMLTSAMFFSFGGEKASDKYTLRIGSLKLDLRGVIIGIQAGFIAIPMTTLILYLFRNSRPHSERKNRPKKDKELETSQRCVMERNENTESQSVVEIGPKCSESHVGDAGFAEKKVIREETPIYHIQINSAGETEYAPDHDCALNNEPPRYGSTETLSADDRTDEPGRGKNAYRNRLPHFCLYIAWFLSFVTVASCLLVILFYSMMWGDAKSKQWLLSIFTGFFQSMFIVQPFKLLVVSIIASAILKMPENEDEVLDAYTLATRHTNKEKQVDTSEDIENSRHAIKKLSEEQRLKARIHRLREVRFNRLCRDVSMYTIFLVFLFLVVKGYRDPASFSLAQASGITGSGFKAITDIDSTWQWVQRDLIKGLYSTTWYNGQKIANKMTPDQASFLVGTVRLRQIRIKPGTCQFTKEFIETNHNKARTCNDYFSLSSEDETRYDVGWKTRLTRRRRSVLEIASNFSQRYTESPGSNQSAKARQRRALRALNFAMDDSEESAEIADIDDDESLNLTALMLNGKITTNPETWKYKETSDLKGFPYIGKFAIYSGGGYASSFDPDATKAYFTSVSLRYYDWLNHLSRALFAEFSLYNANSNLFGTAFIFVEFLPHGGAVSSGSIFVYKLYRYNGPNGKLIMASEILVLGLLFCFIYRDMRRLYLQGFKYFKKFWNIIDTTITVSVFATLILWFSRWYQGDRNLLSLRKNPNSFVSFQYAAAADEAMVSCLGFIVFFSVLKLIQYIQFFPMILQLTTALHQSSGPMFGFMLPFAISFTAFASFAFVTFGSNMESFTSFLSAIATQFLMMLGGSNFEALREIDPILGPAYFTLFVLFQVFFIFNLLIATLNESICAQAEIGEEERAFIDFMVDRLQNAISRFSRPSGGQVSEPTEPTSSTNETLLSTNEANETSLSQLLFHQTKTRTSESTSKRGEETLFKNFDSAIDKVITKTTSLEQQNEIDMILIDVIVKLRR